MYGVRLRGGVLLGRADLVGLGGRDGPLRGRVPQGGVVRGGTASQVVAFTTESSTLPEAIFDFALGLTVFFPVERRLL